MVKEVNNEQEKNAIKALTRSQNKDGIKGSIKDVDEQDIQFHGLEDGGHVVVRCSNCNVPLLDIWVTRPQEEYEWNVMANCGHCGDHSWPVSFKGGWHYGPTEYVALKDAPEPSEDGKVLVVDTIKVKDYVE